MIIAKEIVISKPIEEVWEVLGNQFGEIDRWSSLIHNSTVSGEAKLPGLSYSVRTTNTTQGITKQELTSFDSGQHSLSYKSLSGTPFFIKSANAHWSLTKLEESSTKMNLELKVETGGIMGIILGPVAKIKLGKLGDELMDDFKFFLENGKPHARKVAAMSKN
ncbi:MAG: SRPBCC family protein [Bacteroidetes bacterium]|nr:SRPBCC family protein [Bacteroidota bacterium]